MCAIQGRMWRKYYTTWCFPVVAFCLALLAKFIREGFIVLKSTLHSSRSIVLQFEKHCWNWKMKTLCMLIIWYLQKSLKRLLPDHQFFLHVCDVCFDSSYQHLFKEPVALCNSLFSSVRQEPLIQKLCFSSNLTVIAIWKLAQQNWISNNAASLLVDLQYFRF